MSDKTAAATKREKMVEALKDERRKLVDAGKPERVKQVDACIETLGGKPVARRTPRGETA